MNLLTARMTDTIIYRGMDKAVRLQIFDENGDPFNVTDHNVTLYLSRDCVDLSPLIEKEAVIVNAAEGKVRFEFASTDTIGLLTRSYYIEVYAEYSNERWIVFTGTIGILPTIKGSEVSE